MTTVNVNTIKNQEDSILMNINISLPVHLKISSFLNAIWFSPEYSKNIFNLCDTKDLHRHTFYRTASHDKWNNSDPNKFCIVKAEGALFQFTNYTSNLTVTRHHHDDYETSKHYPVFKDSNNNYCVAYITNTLYNLSFIVTVDDVKYLVTFDEVTIRNEHTDNKHLKCTDNGDFRRINTDDDGNRFYKGVVDFYDNEVLISKVSYEFKNTYSISVLQFN